MASTTLNTTKPGIARSIRFGIDVPDSIATFRAPRLRNAADFARYHGHYPTITASFILSAAHTTVGCASGL